MRTYRGPRLLPCALLASVGLATTALALDDLAFITGRPVSEEASAVPGGALPGGSASKGKIVRLVKTPAGVNDGRLVIVYGDANTTAEVWHPKGGLRLARDIFSRFSDDEGATWSDPVNLSNSANAYSAITDFDGDGFAEPYWGDSGKPTVFNNGNTLVVSWTDKYVPGPRWTWGASGTNPVQGQVSYPDLEVYPLEHVVPYSGLMLAISTDGGATWNHGGDNPPLQMTYGRRDALQDVHRGNGPNWVITWQEDPEGLQPGEADGPGDGSSGATVSKGTDIWYGFTTDIVNDAIALRDNRTPLSNNSSYVMGGLGGFPLAGVAGDVENHGSCRANLFLVKDAGVFTTLVAYEETKGVPDVLEGKTIQYHSFPFDQPVIDGDGATRHGAPGTSLTGLLPNSRRARLVTQPPNGVSPAIAIFWREGFATEGGPADIMLKLSLALDEASVAAAPALNVSAETPTATMATMQLDTEFNPIEDARAHRTFMRGDQIIVGYLYTWNGPLARYTDMANYDFWVRRSLDGGATWLPPQNVSNLPDTTVNVKEPRLVGPSKSGTQDDAAFVVAFGTETNVYEGVEEPEPLDVFITRSFDQGQTFDPVVPVAASLDHESESQLRVNDDVGKVYAVWMADDGLETEVCFGISSPWQDLGHALAGEAGEPLLVGEGPLRPATMNALDVSGAPAFAPAVLLLAPSIVPTPFKGGVLLPLPDPTPFALVMTEFGDLHIDFWWPGDLPAETPLVLQYAIADPLAPFGVSLSNGLAGTSR